MTKKPKELSVIEEKNRSNKFISSLLFSRATVFHPASRLTPTMQTKLALMAQRGGVSIDHPLESVEISSFGKNFRVELHNNYLLHPHRDVLETLLAYAKLIKIDDNALKKGSKITWRSILTTLPDAKPASDRGLDEEINSKHIVLSMSLYDLAKKMKIKPIRSNYKLIEDRIFQLNTAKLFVSELDKNGMISTRKPLSFIKDFLFCYDSAKIKNGMADKKQSANHVFVIPDQYLLEAIKNHGYYYRLEQHKMTHYNSYAVRSFIKWMTTHEPNFFNTKRLSWAIEEYMASLASITGASFKYDLKKGLIEAKDQIEEDFQFQLIAKGKDHQFFYIGEPC